jgi:hypothetical protein
VAGARSRVLPRGRNAAGPLAVRKEFGKITKAARLGGAWTPRELRHSFVSILSAHDARLEDITDPVGHSSTSVTETVYRHEIRAALTDNATAVNRTLKANATELACPAPGSHWLPNWLPKLRSKNPSDQSGRRDLNPRPLDPQSRMTRLGRSEGVGRRASHLRQHPNGVAVGLGESTCVGSRFRLPFLAPRS